MTRVTVPRWRLVQSRSLRGLLNCTMEKSRCRGTTNRETTKSFWRPRKQRASRRAPPFICIVHVYIAPLDECVYSSKSCCLTAAHVCVFTSFFKQQKIRRYRSGSQTIQTDVAGRWSRRTADAVIFELVAAVLGAKKEYIVSLHDIPDCAEALRVAAELGT
jgi:hypothetical protein